MSAVSASVPVALSPRRDVSLFQLYLLRAAYLLLVVGLGISVWPPLLQRAPWALTLCPWNGIGNSVLAALSLLAILGLRYPLTMLPLLVFELTWKSIWLLAVALPIYLSHTPIDDALAQTIRACLMAVVFVFLIPWRYVVTTFARQPGDRWK
jgi:hypothetical protein